MADDLIMLDSTAPNLILACKQMTYYVNKYDGLHNYARLCGA